MSFSALYDQLTKSLAKPKLNPVILNCNVEFFRKSSGKNMLLNKQSLEYSAENTSKKYNKKIQETLLKHAFWHCRSVKIMNLCIRTCFQSSWGKHT